jgi:hypothetical protein
MIYKTMTAAALAVVLASPAFAQSGATNPKGETPPKMQTDSAAPKADKGMTTGQSSSSSGTMQKDQNAQSGQSSGSMNQSSGSMTDKAGGSMTDKSGADTAAKDKASQDKPSMAAGSAGEKKQAGFLQTEGSDQWRASKLIGASVVGPDDKSIGDINEILLDKDGGVEAVVVGVGGFLGIGEKNVAIPFDSLNVQRTEGQEIEKITVSFSKEELENAPKFAYAEEQSRAATTGTRPGASPMGARPPAPASNQPRQ